MSPASRQSIDDAITALREGSLVVVLSDTDRENQVDLIVGAQFATEDRRRLDHVGSAVRRAKADADGSDRISVAGPSRAAPARRSQRRAR
jgi:hypothetical protein